VRIFGIAFTEEADYKLIQALSQKTGGDYYRALRAEDIQGVFQSIREAISKPRPKPEPSASSPVPVETTGSRMGLVVVAIVGLIVFGVVAVIFMTRRKKGDAAASLISADIEDSTIPDAVLIGMGPSGPVTHKITKRVMKIGRMEKEKVAGKPALDIELNDKGVPAFHSTIEYRDQSFYLVDQRSTNGTFLNGQRITSEVRLKGGDEIAFDRCKFRFVLPEMAARGGTVLSPPPAGGTVLRAPGSPLVPAPQQEEIPPPVSREEEEGTRVKTAMCPNHPSFRATELCPVCKKGYCKDCMVEKDGKPICKECAK
jgi:pSer/pThr/pTyr-binding forkhead associated (FHA) protein